MSLRPLLKIVAPEMKRLFQVLDEPFFNELQRFPAMSRLEPAADVKEDEKAYTITTELPGVDKNQVSIECSDSNTLNIKAQVAKEAEDKQATYWTQERYFGSLQRSFSLPNIDQEGINASFKDGVLKVTVPKKKGTRKAIEISE